MKRNLFIVFFLGVFSLLAASPWSDDAFSLVESDTPKNIRRAIETDYSFKNFTRMAEKENLLMAALKNSRSNDVIAILLDEAQISPDSKTKSGVTALMYACQYENDIQAVRSVLLKNARKDSKKAKRILSKDKNGLTCFDYARKNEIISQDVLDLLSLYAEEPPRPEPVAEDVPPLVETPFPVEETPLAEEAPPAELSEPELPLEENPSAEENVEESIEEVLEVPAEPVNTLMDFSSLTAPAVIPESIYLYDYADDRYAKIPIPDNLIEAENSKHLFIPDANKTDKEGRSQLMFAAKAGDTKRIADLLYSGAKIDARDNQGWSALMYAARYQQNPDVISFLLYKGAQRTLKNNYGITALMLSAAYSENPEVLSLLIDTYPVNSEEVRQAFAYGISNNNSTEVLQAFIDKNVSLDIPFNGKTPLMLACQTNKNTKIIEWLLEKGASKYKTEASTGKTAYDYAKENKNLPHNVAYWALNPNS